MSINIGTAGWSIPQQVADMFPATGSALERYAARFPVGEINSSFHRPHRRSTWERWRDSVPAAFRFSVKVPKLITHQQKLVDCAEALDAFIEQANGLEEKLAIVLVQLPPKLAFDEAVAGDFLADLVARTPARIVCEPRHPSWFEPAIDAFLSDLKVARVAADPAICEAAALPGGWRKLSYTRLHGSPVMYRSSYEDRIDGYAARLERECAEGRDVWCIFDNTASSAAASDALALLEAFRLS